MDPQTFVRLSVGQLGLRLPGASARKACHCEIRLRGFPVQIAAVPLANSSEFNIDPHANAAVFSLDEPGLKALPTSRWFRAPEPPYLEIVVYVSRRDGGGHCVGLKRRLVGAVRVDVGPEWRDGKPVLLRHGWTGIGRAAELHVRVRVEADPRYVFRFEDEVALNPQVVQLHGGASQPIFSCKFIRDVRRASQPDHLGGQYWSSSGSGVEKETDMAGRRRERKGWKVAIHDLSGSAVAAAFMATPFVPATGSDTVARSNPGAWLIVRADTTGSSESWQPWGRLEAWRECAAPAGGKDAVCLRLHLLPERRDACVLVSETPLSCDKGGEFSIDMDRQSVLPEDAVASETPSASSYCAASMGESCAGGGFVMSCSVQGEAATSSRPPLVHLAARHVMCMEDAAMFLALAAAVDLSVKACRPFRSKTAAAKKKTAAGSSSPDPLELDT